jgi:AraC family transcriptional activator of pobA
MNGLFAACALKDPDIDLLQNRFLNRPIFGIVLIEGGLCFSYFPEFGLSNKPVKGGIGYLCFFAESFLSGLLRKRILELPMFAPGNSVEYVLSEQDHEKAILLFLKIIDEQDSSYQYKFDLIRTYLSQLLHLVMKMG